MNVGMVVTAFPITNTAPSGSRTNPGIQRCALHDGPDRLVMIEKYESEQALSDDKIPPVDSLPFPEQVTIRRR